MIKKHVFLLVLFSLGIRLAYLGVSLVIEKPVENGKFIQKYQNLSKRNDAYWYERIAVSGYEIIETRNDLGYVRADGFKQSNWAFFPCYPMMNRLLMDVSGTDFDGSASMISFVFSALAMIGVYWFCCLCFENSELAFYSALLLFSFPFAFYFSMFYTEAVFLTVLIFSFVAVHKNRTFFLPLLLVPLVLLRPNGVVLLIPLYLFFLERSGLIVGTKSEWKEILGLENLKRSLVFSSGPLAFVGYCVYQYCVTGYFFAFAMAQVGWFKSPGSPLAPLFRGQGFVYDFNSVYAIVGVILAVVLSKKMPLSFSVLVWVSLLAPLASGSVISIPRYVSVVFPLFMFLASHIHRWKIRNVILVVVLILQLVSLYPWIKLHPLGY